MTPDPTHDPQADPAASGAADAAPTPTPTLEAQLAELQVKNLEMTDAFLRARAEVENVRRRGEDETAKARKFAIEAFAESLLPVLDSLQAALASDRATAEQMSQGVRLTQEQLLQALERNKVVAIAPATGARFDPHQHQAISVVAAAQEANTVVTLLQTGYSIAERVLRPALVTVAAAQ